MKRTKIAIIAHPSRAGGGATIAINFLKALKNIAQNEQFMVVYSAGYGYEQIELPANSEVFVYEGSHRPLARYWFERVRLPKLVDSYNPDVVFGIGNTGLIHPNVPQALFIQQAWVFYNKRHYPEMSLYQKLRLAELRSQIKSSLPRTNLIFCQTPVVKQRFSEKYRYPADQMKILRFPPPVETTTKSDLEVPSIFDKSSGNFYVILLTRYLPHRNPSILIPLCRSYGSQIRSAQIKFITTIKEDYHRGAGIFLRNVFKCHLEDIIINVGHLRSEEVSSYLSNSDVMWLPTLAETLCLPYLEAMCLGVPILAPDLDFARYVCGKAAIFYDPWDIDSIFKCIMLIRNDASLRQQLIKNGKDELTDRSRFAESWEEVASEMIQDLRMLVRQN